MNVVITGSTKGIGYAMAKEFLHHGDQVIISSRSGDRVSTAVANLKKEMPQAQVWGIPCDVSRWLDVEALARFAKEQLGTLDFWINNAGTDGYQKKPLVEFSVELLQQIVDTNLLGTLFGCRAALTIMIPQGHGHILNFDGLRYIRDTHALSCCLRCNQAGNPPADQDAG